MCNRDMACFKWIYFDDHPPEDLTGLHLGVIDPHLGPFLYQVLGHVYGS